MTNEARAAVAGALDLLEDWQDLAFQTDPSFTPPTAQAFAEALAKTGALANWGEPSVFYEWIQLGERGAAK